LKLPCWTARQTQESKWRNDALRGRNLLLDDRQKRLDAFPVAGGEISADGCAKRIRMVRIERHPPLIALRRLVLPIELGQSIAANKERICVIRIDCNRVVRKLQSLGILTECMVRKGAVDQRFLIVILEGENALIA